MRIVPVERNSTSRHFEVGERKFGVHWDIKMPLWVVRIWRAAHRGQLGERAFPRRPRHVHRARHGHHLREFAPPIGHGKVSAGLVAERAARKATHADIGVDASKLAAVKPGVRAHRRRV